MSEDGDNVDISISYLCINAEIPTFVFALVQCVAIILFIVDIILSWSVFLRKILIWLNIELNILSLSTSKNKLKTINNINQNLTLIYNLKMIKNKLICFS